jgi:hypothetical protein
VYALSVPINYMQNELKVLNPKYRWIVFLYTTVGAIDFFRVFNETLVSLLISNLILIPGFSLMKANIIGDYLGNLFIQFAYIFVASIFFMWSVILLVNYNLLKELASTPSYSSFKNQVSSYLKRRSLEYVALLYMPSIFFGLFAMGLLMGNSDYYNYSMTFYSNTIIMILLNVFVVILAIYYIVPRLIDHVPIRSEGPIQTLFLGACMLTLLKIAVIHIVWLTKNYYPSPIPITDSMAF